MADQLRADPGIGELKRAQDRNGKFQMSRVKVMARDAAERIAAVPRTYYFNFEYLPSLPKQSQRPTTANRHCAGGSQIVFLRYTRSVCGCRLFPRQ
jgi:hypothetical protein